jgi:hypothetical protein
VNVPFCGPGTDYREMISAEQRLVIGQTRYTCINNDDNSSSNNNNNNKNNNNNVMGG